MSDKTTADYGFPEATPENRAEIGCYAKEPGDSTACWCGHHIVDGYGCCHECVSRKIRGWD